MSIKDCCLTCLSYDKEMRYVHTSICVAGEDVRLSEILEKFYNYKVSSEEQFPENLCISCVHQLTITHSFKVLIETSFKKLQNKCTNLQSSHDNNFDGNVGSEDDQIYTSKNPYKKKKQKKKKTIDSQMLKQKPFDSQVLDTDTKPTLFCVECKSEFQSLDSLNEHCINNHPVTSEVGRGCEYCNAKFEDYRSLVLHRKLHLKPYICQNCWEGFFNIDDLNSHSCQPNVNKTKNNTDKMLQQCDQCGKSYPQSYIKVHLLTHSNERPYSCKFCPKKFKVPGGLHSHILWNHKRTRNHKCEVCNASFISSSSRSSHIRKNHLKEKKYGCDGCGKRFFSKSELQRHSLTHTGVKNFHCHMCEKSYLTRYGLNVHLKSHTQIESMAVLTL